MTDGYNYESMPSHVEELLERYGIFIKKTEKVEHGELISIRGIRTGDFALYSFCLPKLAEYLFCFNHVNYARWIVRYHDNLLKLEETHKTN